MSHNKGQPRKSVNGLSGKFKRMMEVYRYFASPWAHVLNFDDNSAIELFNYESYGTPMTNKDKNGFYVGKQWLNTNVAMWMEDRYKGHLVVSELYDDPNLPNWWLDSIFQKSSK